MSNLDNFLEAVAKNDLNAVRNYFRPEYLYVLDKNQFTGFHSACDAGLTEIVKFFLDQNINLEVASPNGWTGLHWAAGNGRDDVVALLLARGAKKEAETSRKHRPIHLSVIGNHEKSLRILLANGCDCFVKKDNKTPLEMAIELGSDLCESLLRKWIGYDKIFNIVRQHQYKQFTDAFLIERICVLEAGTTKSVIDVAIEAEFHDCLEYILSQDLSDDVLLESLRHSLDKLKMSVDDFMAQYRLYHSIMFDMRDKFEDYCLIGVVNGPWALTGQSFLELCVRHKRKTMVEYVMQSLLETGQTLWVALELAKSMGLVNIENAIVERLEYLRIKERASYNRLHVAVQDNRVDVVEFLLSNELVDANECQQVVGSPLCLALTLGYGRCVQSLLDHKVDVNVFNKYRQLALHIAIENGMSQFIPTIIDQTLQLDRRDCFQFTALHHSTISKDDATCRLLLNEGANILSKLKISTKDQISKALTAVSLPLSHCENPISLSLKIHRKIMPSLMEKIDEHNVHTPLIDGSTFLHLSARLLSRDTCLTLIEKGAHVNVPNKHRNTPLHSLFLETFPYSWQDEGFLDTLRVLVYHGADINALNNDRVSGFHCAFQTKTRSVISATISHADYLDCQVGDIIDVYSLEWPDVLDRMLSLLNDDFKTLLIHHTVDIGLDDFIDFLLERSSPDFKLSIVEDCLLKAATIDNESLFRKFLQMDSDVPKILPCGQTLLTRLIVDNNLKYSLLLAKSDIGDRYVDLVNVDGQSPLYLAAGRLALKLCKYLVIESHSLDYKDLNDETALEQLFKSSAAITDVDMLKKVEKIVKSMINAGMDINRVNKSQQRAITLCQNPGLKHKLETFYEKNLMKRPRLQIPTPEERNICEVCLSNSIDCQFGCGHPFCRQCATTVPSCPKCRQPKLDIIPLYLE